MKLTNRTILITGGSTGIGLAFARRFAEFGNKVVVTGRNQETLDAVRSANASIEAIRCDHAEVFEIAALAEAIERQFPALDFLINNAGVGKIMRLDRPIDKRSDLTAEIDVNFSGVVRTTSAFTPLLMRNRGTVMNVSSSLAYAPLAAMPVYCATKAAVHSYTQSLRFQLEGSGIQVIELLPPAVRTALATGFDEAGVKTISTEDLVDQTIAALKAGQVEIKPGQAKLLAAMRRLAPSAINKILWRNSQALLAQGAA